MVHWLWFKTLLVNPYWTFKMNRAFHHRLFWYRAEIGETLSNEHWHIFDWRSNKLKSPQNADFVEESNLHVFDFRDETHFLKDEACVKKTWFSQWFIRIRDFNNCSQERINKVAVWKIFLKSLSSGNLWLPEYWVGLFSSLLVFLCLWFTIIPENSLFKIIWTS